MEQKTNWVNVEDGFPPKKGIESTSNVVIGEDEHGWPEAVRYNHLTGVWFNQKIGILKIVKWAYLPE